MLRVLRILIPALIVGIAPASGEDAETTPIELVVEVDQRAVNLDDCVPFSLELAGGALNEVLESWDPAGTVLPTHDTGISRFGLRPSTLFQSQQYYFAPSEVGVAHIGPFTLRIGGLELRSNSVEVIVAPAPEGGETIRLIPHVERARVGVPFRLTVVGFSGTSILTRRHARTPSLIDPQIDQMEIVSSHWGMNGHGCVEGFTYKYVFVYELTAAEAGRMVLGAESFEDLPEGATVQSASVDVRN